MIWFGLALLVFILTAAVYNLQLFSHYCHYTFDLAIFLEAFKKFSLAEWDPYISVRQVTIFQDHWEPILFFLSPLAPYFALPTFGFGVEISFFVLTALALFMAGRQHTSSSSDFGITLAILFLINRDTFEAVFYPIHPTTWAVFPLALAALAIPSLMPTRLRDQYSHQSEPSQKTFLRLFFIVFLLNIFSEQYSLSALGLILAASVFLPRRSPAILLLPLTAGLTWWAFSGRSLLVGEIFHRTGRVKLNFSEFVQLYQWDFNQYKTLTLFFLSFAPLIWFLMMSVKYWNFSHFRKLALWVGLFGPLILGRVLSNSFGLHYNAVLVVAAVTFFFLLIDSRAWPSRKVSGYVFCFALIFTMGKWTKSFNAYANDRLPACVHVPREPSDQYKAQVSARKAQLDYFMTRLSQEPVGTKILAQGNLVPNLLTISHLEIFHLGAFEVRNTESFDWIFVERGLYGNFSDVSPERMEQVISILKTQVSPPLKILADGPSLFVAKGVFSKNILKSFFYDQNYQPIK
jgi:hypothetical protein